MGVTGVVLINTGTPDDLTEESIRVFLQSMLSDPALISVPPFIWQCILKHFILPTRPKKTIGLYRKMWTDEGPEFMRISRDQRAALERVLAERKSAGDVRVRLAMRYSSPSIRSQLAYLKEEGCDTIVAVPLYPQYVRVCAGTCLMEFDRCIGELREEGWNPVIRKVTDFFENPSYRAALAAAVDRAWQRRPGGKLVVSFHSTVLADIEDGDPYREQAEKTASNLAEDLGIAVEDVLVSYQSRFDSRKWLQPFTADVLEHLAVVGVEDVCVVCPGFVAENIESKVEAGEQLHDVFLAHAVPGARYTYVPTLDDDPGLIDALADEVQAVLSR